MAKHSPGSPAVGTAPHREDEYGHLKPGFPAGRTGRTASAVAAFCFPFTPASMNALFRDIRYGFRSLTQSPMLAIVATLALTIGIALTTTMFSILYGALMKGLPFEEGDRIVMVRRS